MTRIHLQTFDIGKIEHNSALLNSANNHPSHWSSRKKENVSFGEINGKETTLKDLLMLTDDEDILDLK